MERTQIIDVFEGDFRIRCYDKESALRWVEFILDKGGIPRVELKEAA